MKKLKNTIALMMAVVMIFTNIISAEPVFGATDAKVSKKTTKLTMTLNQEQLPMNQEMTVNITFKDADNNPMVREKVDIIISREMSTVVSDTAITDEKGEISWSFAFIEPGTYKISVSSSPNSDLYIAPDKIEKTIIITKNENILRSSAKMDYGTADVSINLNDQLKKYRQNGVVLKATDIISVGAVEHAGVPYADVSINKEDGTIIVKNKKAGTEQLAISFETEMYSFKEIIDVTVNKYPLKIKADDIHTGAKGETVFDGSKIYDGTKVIAVSARIDDTSLDRLTEQKKKEITNKQLIFPSCDSGIQNVKGEEELQDIRVQLSLDKSDFFDKENYCLANGTDVPAQIRILKKELSLTVSDNSRSYRSKEYVRPLTDAGVVTVSGFVEGDQNVVENSKEFKLPEVVDTTWNGIHDVMDDTAECGVAEKVLILDRTTGNPTGNYKFYFGKDETRYKKGSLTITEEKIEDTNKKYIKVDQDSSENVFQKDEKIYFGNGKTQDRHAVARFTVSSDSGYNTLHVDGKKLDLENGLELIPDADMASGDKITKKVSLSEEVNGKVLHKTEDFYIDFIYDGDAPECNAINFGTTNKVVSDFISAITFGLFDRLAVEASVSIDEDKELSGLNNWTYCIVNVHQDKNYKENIEEYLSSQKFIEPEKDQKTIVIGASKKGENLIDNNNYVVYVRTEDQVGNAKIFGSDGIVLEDNNDISVEFSIDNEPVKKYYKDSVKLKIAAEENGSVYSGLKQLDYDIRINGSPQHAVEEHVYQLDADQADPESRTPKDVTLEQLKGYSKLTVTKDFEISTSESQEIVVIAAASDHAGNRTKKPATCSFVLDGVKPVVTSSFYQKENGEKLKNDRHTDSNVVYEVIVKERYLDQSSIILNINGNSFTPEKLIRESADLGILCNMDQIPDTSTTRDDSEYKFTLEFTKDGEYNVSVTLSDLAGNMATDTPEKFIIDTGKQDVNKPENTKPAKPHNISPKTGDENHLTGNIIILIAAFVLALSVTVRKKENK